jgi:mRNA interferase RelE/StbE
MNIVILKFAERYLDRQPRNQKARLLSAIYRLPEGDTKALKGSDGVFRLRVGDYRVIFHMGENDNTIYVREIGPRGDVYKG